MRIAVNARSILLASRTGIGRYTYHLLDTFGQMASSHQFWIHVPKKIWDTKRNLPHFDSPHLVVKNDYFGLGLRGADVYHYPSPGPIDRKDSKIIVTIHDLVYKMYPQSHTQETIDATEKYMQQIVGKADHLIFISRNTQEDFRRHFDFPQEKTSVVYNGVDHKLFFNLDQGQKQEAKALLEIKGIKDPFILFIGTLEPRKNLAGLLEAFAALKKRKTFKGKLVVVGRKGWMHEPTEALMETLGIKQDIISLGYVTDEELRSLYSLAEVVVFPSFYEGFGFPIVEAFCCGAALVTSNNSSCGEIAGDAALTIDPHSSHEIANAIAQLLEDKVLSQQLRQKAIARSKEFSFINTAGQTLKVYEKSVV
jgi:glycosyltransferase involved in cell wall biosynthesis